MSPDSVPASTVSARRRRIAPLTLVGGTSARELGVDWRRLAERSLLAFVGVFAVVALAKSVGNHYAADFHGGIWRASQAILGGHSPYASPNADRLFRLLNPYIPPPLLAILAIPLAVLPFWLASLLWSAVCAGAFVAALWLLGLRDRRAYVLALCSFPFVESLEVGGPEPLLALGVAAAWRYRDSWRGAVCVGAVIAAKLLAWPLIIWLLVTRRIRCALIAIGMAVGTLVASWACIGFKGLVAYPRLVAADARAFERISHSVVSAAMRLGASEHVAVAVMLAVAAGIASAIVRVTKGSDRGWFTAAIAFGLFASPLVWMHYLVILFVPLAIARYPSRGAWLLTAGLWLLPFEPPPTVVEVLLVLVIASSIAFTASRPARRPA
jgi:alpha-1,2-mannosyltransferase